MSTPGDAKNSRRIDVPKEHIPTAERRGDGMKYFDIDDPETKDINPAIKLIDDIFAVRNSGGWKRMRIEYGTNAKESPFKRRVKC